MLTTVLSFAFGVIFFFVACFALFRKGIVKFAALPSIYDKRFIAFVVFPLPVLLDLFFGDLLPAPFFQVFGLLALLSIRLFYFLDLIVAGWLLAGHFYLTGRLASKQLVLMVLALFISFALWQFMLEGTPVFHA